MKDRNINVIHSPLLPEEEKRIEASHGTVSEHNIAPFLPLVPRVFANKECTRGGLAMSRSIGDQLIHRYGVISTPTSEVVPFSKAEYEGCRILLLFGSDGFLSYLDKDEIVRSHFLGPSLVESLSSALQSAQAHLLERTQHKYADDASGVAVSIQFCCVCFACSGFLFMVTSVVLSCCCCFASAFIMDVFTLIHHERLHTHNEQLHTHIHIHNEHLLFTLHSQATPNKHPDAITEDRQRNCCPCRPPARRQGSRPRRSSRWLPYPVQDTPSTPPS